MQHAFDWLALNERRLSPEERQRAEAHLAACPACRAKFAALADLADELDHLPKALKALPRPAQSWAGVWARAQRPVNRAYPIRPLAASLSLVVIFLLASSPFSARWSRYAPLMGNIAVPQASVETPHPPQGDRLATSTQTSRPAHPGSSTVTIEPHPLPVATPLPNPTS